MTAIGALAAVPGLLRLNIGCGHDYLDGWVNVDRSGADIAADLEKCRAKPLPFDANTVDEFRLSHVIEHINDTLGLMEELHRIAKAGAIATIRVPYGSSDDAWEDPTHVRAYFLQSWGYFSQPYYWRADYGFRGDWTTVEIILLAQAPYDRLDDAEFLSCLKSNRNVVQEMTARLVAIKPTRLPKRELQTQPKITILNRWKGPS